MSECSAAQPRPTFLALAGLMAAAALLLAACGSAPTRVPSDPKPTASSPSRSSPASPFERDGPQAQAPADLASVPNAEPQVEAIRAGGPNNPYEVAGRSYVPLTQDVAHVERGLASWYGRKFHGRRTAMGEVYNMYAMTAAHPTLPLPSYARVRNPANGKEVVVRVNDRGPFHPGRIIDLSYTAALKLDLLRGVAPVEIERITFDAIRSGQWRGTASDGAVAGAAPAAASMAKADAQSAGPAAPQGASPRLAEAAGRPAAATAPADASTSTLPATANAAAAVGADTAPEAALLPVSTAAPATTAAAEAAPQAATPATAANTASAAGGGYFVQIAAFKQRDGAESFHRKVVADLSWLSPLLAVFTDAASVHRLQAGPYRTRDEAQGVAQQVREALQLVPMVVQRR
jgi:rare lipoprotein A